MWATAALAVLCALSGSLALPPALPSTTTTTPTPTPTPTSAPAPAHAPSPATTSAATAAAADSMAAETTLHRAPWQQTLPDSSGKAAASGDVEIIRSIELDLVFDDNENRTHTNSSSTIPTLHDRLNEYGGGRADTSHFKPSPAIPFRPEDVLLATSSELNHIPCKEIRTRSISVEDEPDNDFGFQSRLLLGRALLRSRASDSAESASVRQSRVLDFEPIHTSKNDYPVESVSRRTTAAAARRLAARTRARNLANQTQVATSPKTPATPARGGTAAPTTAAPTATPPPTEAPQAGGPGEGVAAAASNLEFGAKTAHSGERGASKYRAVSSTPRSAAPVATPTFLPTHVSSSAATPRAEADVDADADADTETGAESGAESVHDASGDPYSSVSIQRGNVDPIPYAPPRDVHLVPLRAHKQPTQVIFIQPYAPSDLKQLPTAPADAPAPAPVPASAPAHPPARTPFDAHQWVPVYVQEAYVPLLVDPRRQPHLHHLDSLHHRQHHALPITFTENRHTLGDFSSVALQYPSEAWSWTSQHHSTPSSFSGESSVTDRNYIR